MRARLNPQLRTTSFILLSTLVSVLAVAHARQLPPSSYELLAARQEVATESTAPGDIGQLADEDTSDSRETADASTSSLSGGVIAGIAVGGVAAAVAIFAVGFAIGKGRSAETPRVKGTYQPFMEWRMDRRLYSDRGGGESMGTSSLFDIVANTERSAAGAEVME